MALQHFIRRIVHSIQMGFLLLLLLMGSTHARIVDLEDYAYNEVEDDAGIGYGSSPFIAKMFADSVNGLAKTRRRRHGIYEECCRKGCSYAELLSYCL